MVSEKMDKTVVVLIKREFAHPMYKKRIVRSKRVKVHDERDKCRKGDTIRIKESRPLSKEKCWRVIKILKSEEKENA